ncbi:MAG: carbohydrate-binding domain-containing protein [Clostridiales bacterium]|nr:carbohydrate-binding domain-containing protein [Clostridiales bacterium]
MKNLFKTLIIITVLSLVCFTLAGCVSKGEKEETASGETVPVQKETSAGEKTAKSEKNKTTGGVNGTAITLSGSSASVSGSGAVYENGNVVITSGGSYTLSGEINGGQIVVDAGDEDVTLIFDSVKITSSDSSAVNVVKAGSVIIELKDGTDSELTDASKYSFDGDYSDAEKEEPDACVFSKADLTITGQGSLTVNANYKNGIKSKDNLTIENTNITVNSENNALTGSDGVTLNGATLDLTAKGDGIHSNSSIEIKSGDITIKSDDDGIHADDTVTINSGTLNITAHEGIEGTVIKINDGTVTINSSDDGINGAQKVDGKTPSVEINGGNITVTMGSGDTDAIDSNGDIYINGGKITITGQSGFDYDGKAEFNGGEIYLNGEKVTEITNQFAGGMRGFGGADQGGGMRSFADGNQNGDDSFGNLPRGGRWGGSSDGGTGSENSGSPSFPGSSGNEV